MLLPFVVPLNMASFFETLVVRPKTYRSSTVAVEDAEAVFTYPKHFPDAGFIFVFADHVHDLFVPLKLHPCPLVVVYVGSIHVCPAVSAESDHRASIVRVRVVDGPVPTAKRPAIALTDSGSGASPRVAVVVPVPAW